jgi:hypothetical protein
MIVAMGGLAATHHTQFLWELREAMPSLTDRGQE